MKDLTQTQEHLNHLLEVRDLQTVFLTYEGLARAVDGASFWVDKGEAVGIVGESGCGKSVMARSIMRLIPDPPGRIIGGEILFDGVNVLSLSERDMRKIRGNRISMIFQEPMTSLNAVLTVGEQLSEVFRLHQKSGKREALEKSIDMLRMVGIPSPETRVFEYPFQMSGGMRQRVMIAMALACRPSVILADEPTTALDVTIQAQILELIQDLQGSLGTSMVLITHDLGVVAETVRRVYVMYAGKIVEQGAVGELFDRPLHPYTQGLLESMPSLDGDQDKHTERLREIPGTVPDLCALPRGCSFFPRCPQAKAVCQTEAPPVVETSTGQLARCWLYG
jgi:oligopeptide/dipeptide ABC transporter ATP-binding protein